MKALHPLVLLLCMGMIDSFQLRTIKSQRAFVRFAHVDNDPPSITSAKQYLQKKDRPYLIDSKPDSAFNLAIFNFRKEVSGILTELSYLILRSDISKRQSFPEVLGLRLSNKAVKKAEIDREATGGRVDADPIARKLYDTGCLILDSLFDERPMERFWFLETIARIPYFTYVSMLHLYESLGWWREPSLREIHNAEEWNELHHLLIMETLGGDKRWSTRFLGYHVAIGYYWLLILTYLYSPRVAYQFMELLESHAVDTYGTFVTENAEKLKLLPPPDVAVKYYSGSNLYFFDDFQVDRVPGTRRPPCDNLYDVFSNIRDDEMEHVTTMRACQDYAQGGARVVSPFDKYASQVISTQSAPIAASTTTAVAACPSHDNVAASAAAAQSALTNVDEESRLKWQKWAEEVNAAGKPAAE